MNDALVLCAALILTGVTVIYWTVRSYANVPPPAAPPAAPPLPKRDPAHLAEQADDMAVMSPEALAEQFRREVGAS